MTSFATIAAVARRWDVDRATARAALQSANIPASTLFAK